LRVSHQKDVAATFSVTEAVDNTSLAEWVKDLKGRLRMVGAHTEGIDEVNFRREHPMTVNSLPGEEFEMLTSFGDTETTAVTRVVVLQLRPNVFLEITAVVRSLGAYRVAGPRLDQMVQSVKRL